MGRRNLLNKFQVLNGQDTTTDPASSSTDISGSDSITYEIEIDPTVNASLEVKYCNDLRLTNQSVFKSLDFGQATTLVGATETDYLVHITNQAFRHLKLVISNNGGTGNVSAWVSGAVKGA